MVLTLFVPFLIAIFFLPMTALLIIQPQVHNQMFFKAGKVFSNLQGKTCTGSPSFLSLSVH